MSKGYVYILTNPCVRKGVVKFWNYIVVCIMLCMTLCGGCKKEMEPATWCKSGTCTSIFGIPFGTAYDWTKQENVEQYSFQVLTNGNHYTHVAFTLREPFCGMSNGVAVFNVETRTLAWLRTQNAFKSYADRERLFERGISAIKGKYANGSDVGVRVPECRLEGRSGLKGTSYYLRIGEMPSSRRISFEKLTLSEDGVDSVSGSRDLLMFTIEDMEEARKASEISEGYRIEQSRIEGDNVSKESSVL